MSDENNILRVGASVDLAGFQSGMPAAASLVEQNTRRMVDAFVKVLTGSTQASKQVLVDWAGRPFQPAADSAEVMRQSVDISAESIKALGDAMHGVKQDTEQTASGWEGFANKIEGFITHPLDAAGGFAKKLLMDLGPVGAVAVGAAAGLAELGKQAFDLVNSEGAAARQTQNLATQLGLSYEQAKKLGEQARLVDIDIAGLTRVSLRLADALEHGGAEYDALRKLGVNATEAGPALLQTLEKLSQIENVTVRLDAASEVLGKRQAMRLMPLIADYEKLGDVIESLGGKLDEEHVKSLEAARIKINEVGIAWEHIKEAMAARIEPTVSVIVTAVKQVVTGNIGDISGMEGELAARELAKQKAQTAKEAAEDKAALQKSFPSLGLKSPFQQWIDADAKSLDALKEKLTKLESAHKDLHFKLEGEPTPGHPFDEKGAATYGTQEKQITDLKAQIKAAEKAQSGAGVAERNAIAEKKLENDKQLELQMVSASEQTAKQKLHDGVFTIEQETDALRAAEKTRYDIEVDYAHQTDSLKAGTARAEKKPAPEGTNFKLLAAKHEGRDTDIVNAGANKAEARDDTTARDQVRDTQIVAQARVEAEIHASKAALAARHASIDEQTQAERDQATALHAVKLDALNADLALAKEDPLKNKDKIDTLNAQIEAATIQHETKLADITADGTKRKRDEETAYQTAVENAAIATATRVYDFSKARIEEQFKNHEIDAKERIALLREIEEQEYKTQLAAAVGERDTAIEKHGGRTDNADVVNADAKVDTLGAKHEGVTAGLDEESKHAFTNMQQTAVGAINGISQAFEGGISKWLAGTKNFGAAMGQSFRGMADTAINNIVRMTAQMLAAFALQKAIGQKSVMSKAYESAANTWATVTASGIGGPFNPVIAAAEAAGVFALVAALGSFEYGGVVPTTGVKFLHEGERVLTPRDNASFEKAIEVGAAVPGAAGGPGGPGGAAEGGPGGSGASGGAAGDTYNHYEFPAAMAGADGGTGADAAGGSGAAGGVATATGGSGGDGGSTHAGYLSSLKEEAALKEQIRVGDKTDSGQPVGEPTATATEKQIEQTKNLALVRTDISKDATKQMFAEHRVTADQATASLTTAETVRNRIEKTATERITALRTQSNTAVRTSTEVGATGGSGVAGGAGAPGASAPAKVYQISDPRTWRNVNAPQNQVQVGARTFERGAAGGAGGPGAAGGRGGTAPTRHSSRAVWLRKPSWRWCTVGKGSSAKGKIAALRASWHPVILAGTA